MNILFLCHRIPYPPNKGDKIRSFNEIKYLSRNHNLSLAFLIDKKEDIQFIDKLREYCRTIDYDVINPIWQRIKSLPFLLSKKPLTIPYFYSSKLQKAIDKRLSEINFDVIFTFSSPMAEYVLKSKFSPLNRLNGSNGQKRIKLIMDFVDVDSDKWRMYAEYSPFPKSFIYKREYETLRAYERQIGELFDLSIFVSDAEVKVFKSFAPNVNAVSIPNGVDISYFKDSKTSLETDPHISNLMHKRSDKHFTLLFTGAMDYFANEDGVIYFWKEIWPLVKRYFPNTKFYIVGSNPSKKIKSLSKKDRDVIVTGQVKDVREYMHKADVFIAPLRIARGIQNKVLEALAAGLPVIATPLAAQGIECDGEGFLFVEDSAVKFARRTVEFAMGILNKDTDKKIESFLRCRHNWDKNLSKLEKLI